MWRFYEGKRSIFHTLYTQIAFCKEFIRGAMAFPSTFFLRIDDTVAYFHSRDTCLFPVLCFNAKCSRSHVVFCLFLSSSSVHLVVYAQGSPTGFKLYFLGIDGSQGLPVAFTLLKFAQINFDYMVLSITNVHIQISH